MAKKITLPSGGAASAFKRTLGVGGVAPALGRRILLLVVGGVVQNDGGFSFSLAAQAVTSAGVMDAGGQLVRTLWSNRPYDAGLSAGRWDGRLDDLSLAPDGTYTIQVLSSQLRYEWEGVLGNTSFIMNGGNTIHRGYQFIRGMVEVGDFMYFCQHYVEGPPPISKFRKDAPQTKIEILPRGFGTSTGCEHIATDGTLVYYSNYDKDRFNGNTSWVAGIRVSDDTSAIFSGGGTYKPDKSPITVNTINLLNSDLASNYITGLAVQKTGNYLFVAYAGKNQILVANKTTGAVVGTITSLTTPRQLYADGTSLWVISGTNTVAKYSVASDGTIGAATLTLSGLLDPLSVTVSPDGSSVLIGDGGASQQLKAYATSTGAAQWTLGTAGGYSATSVVSTSRFYFSDLSGGINDTFAAYQSDGSFWLGDRGNYRTLRFDGSRSYQTQIAYIPASYTSAVDVNNPLRVMVQYLEYAIDYTKPLASAWKLVANWRNQLPAAFIRLDNKKQNTDLFGAFIALATLSNGRTYGFLRRLADNYFVLAELPAGGTIRVTSLAFDSPVQLGADGSLYRTVPSLNTVPKTQKWTRQALTGFDGQNNPTWSAATVIAQTNMADTDPTDWTGYPSDRAAVRTSSNLLLQFQANLDKYGPARGYGFHLGAVAEGGTGWKWRTAFATSGRTYQGDYPTDGAYNLGGYPINDVGDQIGYAGGAVTMLGPLAVWNYFGEFYRDGQCNYFHVVADNGLNVGQFGTDSIIGNKVIGQAGMAGGVHYATGVIDPNDPNVGYLYHAEEGGFSGLHRWKITGLSTVTTQTALSLTVVTANAFVAPGSGYVDLLADLPKRATLVGTMGRWSRSGVEDVTAEFNGNVRSARTNILSYDRFNSPDLFFKFNKGNESEIYTCTLPITDSANWSLTSVINTSLGLGNDKLQSQAASGGMYLDLLDRAGKVIIRFYKNRLDVNPNKDQYYANTVLIVQVESYTAAASALGADNPLLIKSTAGIIDVSFAGTTKAALSVFETGALTSQPGSLRITMWDNGNRRDRVLGIKALGFRAS